MPRLGGVAVFIAMSVAVLAAMAVRPPVAEKVSQISRFVTVASFRDTLILAASVLFLVGLLDDLRGVKPLTKLAAQTAASIIVCGAGLTIHHVSLIPGYSLELGIFAVPVTVIWLVGMSNAFNLIDGMDGVAGGVAIIALIPIAVSAVILETVRVPIYAVALAGALTGFLRYNLPKARLFMGDSGSLVVGFILAVLAVKSSTDKQQITHAVVPIFALAYPLLDTGIAMMRRWLRGVPLSRADRRHVHHQLAALGLSPKKSLLCIYVASAGAGALGLMAAFAPPAVTFLASMGGLVTLVLFIGLSIRWLQYHEFAAASGTIASAALKAPSVIRDKINARDIATVITQANTIEEIQAILEDSASVFRFAYMKLATPESRRRLPGRITQELQALRLWKLEYPIAHGNAEEYDGLALTIWCSLEVPQRPAGAERIAQIIGPAISAWARSGKYKPALAPYGDRLLHVGYSPHPADRSADRAFTENGNREPASEQVVSP